jgi:hypothetical protein
MICRKNVQIRQSLDDEGQAQDFPFACEIPSFLVAKFLYMSRFWIIAEISSGS